MKDHGGSQWHLDIRPWEEPIACLVKTIRGAHGPTYQTMGEPMAFQVKSMGQPMATICMSHNIMWLYVCDILGNSLSFVLTDFSLCFRYFCIQKEGFMMIVEHTQPRSTSS